MVPSFLLVDGNNIIHAWPDLLELHQQRRGLAHTELERRLLDYQDQTGTRVVLVFDGKGPKINEERDPNGMQVIYTSGSKSADDVIERLALKYAGKYEITVATNDRLEQDLVISAGGFAMNADQLYDLVERAEREMQRLIEKRRRS